MTIETSKLKKKEDWKTKQNPQAIQEPQDNYKRMNICLRGVPKEEESEKEHKKYLKQKWEFPQN